MSIVHAEFSRSRGTHASPSLGAAAHESIAVDEWPTTQRFSRRVGEAMKGADYAASIERPAESPVGAWAVVIGVAGALLGAAAIVVWHS